MQNIEILGNMGEKLVRNILSMAGRQIQDSLDHYDSSKDFLCDGKKVEVKTQQPFVYKNCFSFRKNQLRKCKSVSELYIVSVPPVGKPDYEHGGKVYVVDTSDFDFFEYKTKAGIDMFGIPIKQDSVFCVYDMTEDERNLFTRYTETQYAKL